MFDCPYCGTEIIKAYPLQTAKMRTAITLFKDGKTIGICKGCGKEVELPLILDMDIPRAEVLYVKK